MPCCLCIFLKLAGRRWAGRSGNRNQQHQRHDERRQQQREHEKPGKTDGPFTPEPPHHRRNGNQQQEQKNRHGSGLLGGLGEFGLEVFLDGLGIERGNRAAAFEMADEDLADGISRRGTECGH